MRPLLPALATLALVALPTTASASVNVTAAPRIVSFSEIPRTLPAAGGWVTIIARLMGAQVCQLELLSISAVGREPEPTWSHEGQSCVTLDEQHIRVWRNRSSEPQAITFKLVISFFPEHKRTQLTTTKVFTILVAGSHTTETTTQSELVPEMPAWWSVRETGWR
jgi:hypothetical protein